MENIFKSIQQKNAERGQNILKAFGEGETLEKGKAATVGEIREWGGKKYKKQSNGKWMQVSESHGMTKKEHEFQADVKKESASLAEKDKNHKVSDYKKESSKLHSEQASKLSDKEYDESELSGEKDKYGHDENDRKNLRKFTAEELNKEKRENKK